MFMTTKPVAASMKPFSSIVKFGNVTVPSSSQYETGLWNISFGLNPGELLLVRIERENERLPLADVTEGLVPPAHGTVTFLGDDWQRLSADHAAAQRGKIGRLFEDEGWISDLDVDENIVLAQRHHTQRTEEEIREEALKFARMFGLPGLPRGRPGKVRRWDLRKAACIRAFLGQPMLIILEQPVRGVYADFMAPLLNAVQSARTHGAAVLWTVTDPQIWNNSGIRAASRAKMLGSELRMMEPD
ncbi:MAG: organic solvent ABC transporter ATP-binding protein [Verrucomicrobiota bacterium]